VKNIREYKMAKMTLAELKQKKAALKRIAERKAKLNENKGKKVVRIRMTELKKMIREEYRKSLREQAEEVRGPVGRPRDLPGLDIGRGRPSESGGEFYETDEFMSYLQAGLRGAGKGRREEFDIDVDGDLVRASDKDLISMYDVDGKMHDIYSPEGELMAAIPLDMESLG
jgi:hypothetical protein